MFAHLVIGQLVWEEQGLAALAARETRVGDLRGGSIGLALAAGCSAGWGRHDFETSR